MSRGPRLRAQFLPTRRLPQLSPIRQRRNSATGEDRSRPTDADAAEGSSQAMSERSLDRPRGGPGRAPPPLLDHRLVDGRIVEFVAAVPAQKEKRFSPGPVLSRRQKVDHTRHQVLQYCCAPPATKLPARP